MRFLLGFLTVFLVGFLEAASADVKAFPSAIGYGASSVGGRGGKIIAVENLNASGPGSFRSAVEETGPRIVVFKVGGTIDLNHITLPIKNPYLTIAGQTAPGGGITIRGGYIDILTHNVTIRHVRFRPGPGGFAPGHSGSGDGFRVSSITGTDRQFVILDHCSISWGTDETLSIVGNGSTYTTIQHSIISEAMKAVPPPYNHPEISHSKGMLVTQVDSHLTMLGNLLAHNFDRNPQINAGALDMVNNVIYNYGGPAVINPRFSPILANIIGNVFIAGVDSLPGRLEVHEVRLLPLCRVKDSDQEIECPYNADTRVFVRDNLGTERPDSGQTEFRPAKILCPNFGECLSLSERQLTSSISSATVATSRTAYDNVLSDVGAIVPQQDAVDRRVILSVINRTGKIINEPSEVGGYPALAKGTPYLDTDGDGISDQWERQSGLKFNDASDGSKVDPRNGYTYVENFINELAGDVVTPVATPTPTPTATPTATPTKPAVKTILNKDEVKAMLITKLCRDKQCELSAKYVEGDFNSDKKLDGFVVANNRYAALAYPYQVSKIKSGTMKSAAWVLDKGVGVTRKDRIVEKQQKQKNVVWTALNPLTGVRTTLPKTFAMLVKGR